ncbi:MAG: hypothetical protein SchgKO_19630 [Schleiferiaceae bacterium]
MKKLLFAVSLSCLVFACKKEISTPKEDLSSSQVLKSMDPSDPVIAHFSPLGAIELAPQDFSDQVLLECSNHTGLYLFTPNSGPYSGKVSQIYRYPTWSDVPSKCDESFNLGKKTVSNGNWTWYACPSEGGNCKRVSDEYGCFLIFCDEE